MDKRARLLYDLGNDFIRAYVKCDKSDGNSLADYGEGVENIVNKCITELDALELDYDKTYDIVFDRLYSEETDKCLEIKDKMSSSYDGVAGYSQVTENIAKALIQARDRKRGR